MTIDVFRQQSTFFQYGLFSSEQLTSVLSRNWCTTRALERADSGMDKRTMNRIDAAIEPTGM